VPVLGQVLELGQGLGLEPVLVRVPGLELGPGRHKQPSTRPPRPLSSPTPLFVFYSFSPPKILNSSIKNISLRNLSPPFYFGVLFPDFWADDERNPAQVP